MLYLEFFIYVILSAGGLVLFKLGSQDLAFSITKSIYHLSFNLYLILGVISYICSFILWLYIVTQTKLSLAMPISVGLVSICVVLGSIFFVGETVSLMQWIGIAIVIVGLFVMNL